MNMNTITTPHFIDEKFENEYNNFWKNLIGQQGGFTFDTGIAAHNPFLDDESPNSLNFLEVMKFNSQKYSADKVVVGKKGRKITRKDIQVATDHISDYSNQEKFDNGRSYFFEGIDKSGICWGS